MQSAMGWWRPAAGVAAVLMLASTTASAVHAQGGVFAAFSGSWTGSGQIRLDGGQREAIRCSASYVPRSGGTGLGLSLRCASASGRVELRASLSASGGRVAGTWEERSYNIAGQISGTASGGNLRLSFSGGGVSGSMTVTTSGGSQSISMRTDSVLQGVNVSLRRN
jgi:hypothetical protein